MQTLCGKPLAFGDVEQIREINRQQKEHERDGEFEKAKMNGTLKSFRVRYNIIEPVEDSEIVQALDADHAEKVFWEMNRNSDTEMEITSIKEI